MQFQVQASSEQHAIQGAVEAAKAVAVAMARAEQPVIQAVPGCMSPLLQKTTADTNSSDGNSGSCGSRSSSAAVAPWQFERTDMSALRCWQKDRNRCGELAQLLQGAKPFTVNHWSVLRPLRAKYMLCLVQGSKLGSAAEAAAALSCWCSLSAQQQQLIQHAADQLPSKVQELKQQLVAARSRMQCRAGMPASQPASVAALPQHLHVPAVLLLLKATAGATDCMQLLDRFKSSKAMQDNSIKQGLLQLAMDIIGSTIVSLAGSSAIAAAPAVFSAPAVATAAVAAPVQDVATDATATTTQRQQAADSRATGAAFIETIELAEAAADYAAAVDYDSDDEDDSFMERPPATTRPTATLGVLPPAAASAAATAGTMTVAAEATRSAAAAMAEALPMGEVAALRVAVATAGIRFSAKPGAPQALPEALKVIIIIIIKDLWLWYSGELLTTCLTCPILVLLCRTTC